MVNFSGFFAIVKANGSFSGPVQLHFEYPGLGGAENGKKTLTIPKQECDRCHAQRLDLCAESHERTTADLIGASRDSTAVRTLEASGHMRGGWLDAAFTVLKSERLSVAELFGYLLNPCSLILERAGNLHHLLIGFRRSGPLRWLLLPRALSWRCSRCTNRERRARAASMAVAANLARWSVFSLPAQAAD